MNERAKARISILLVTCMLLSGCAGDADIEEEPEEIPHLKILQYIVCESPLFVFPAAGTEF